MNLATLLLELRPLLAEPRANWKRIVDLLDKHQDLAEYEVARFYVTDAIRDEVERTGRSLDPRERFRAAQAVRLTFAQQPASKILRRLVKDPDPATRAHARRAVHALGLSDVALPDFRFRAPRTARHDSPGGWNPTGWSFGLPYGHLGVVRQYAERSRLRGQKVGEKALPKTLGTPADLSKLLGFSSPDALQQFMRPGAGRGAGYVEFQVPKATGGVRTICAPRAPLKKAQRVILREVLAKLPIHDASHGFVPHRSVVTNARPHEGAAVVIKMDLSDFFPTIHYRRVAGLFEYYGVKPDVAALLAGLTTHRARTPDGRVIWPGSLPQGAPTSPAIANLVARRLDARLTGLAKRAGATYTRYADDLTFSFKTEPEKGVGRFLWWVDQVCQQEGFAENAAKRRVLRRGNQQRVTGVVVNQGLHVPRATRRTFRAILHNCRAKGVDSQARGRRDFRDYLRGFAAYVKMVQPDLGAKWLAEVKALLAEQPGSGGGGGDGGGGDGGGAVSSAATAAPATAGTAPAKAPGKGASKVPAKPARGKVAATKGAPAAKKK